MMRVQQAVWSDGRVTRRRDQGHFDRDLLAVVTICLMFGMQILTVMQSADGPAAFRMVASEGMQSQ